MLGVCALSAE